MNILLYIYYYYFFKKKTMGLNRFNYNKQKTSFDYTWEEYFNILIDMIKDWKQVLSELQIENGDIMPYMKVHLERLYNKQSIDNILSNIVNHKEEISSLNEKKLIWKDEDMIDLEKNMIILEQLDIFRDTLLQELLNK